jgi:hypothetical protein
MIRDLLFAVHELNSIFRENGVPIFIIAAVRSEVLAVVNRTGEEVGRAVYDFSFDIDWSSGERGPSHPLMQLIKQKIKASEIDVFGRQKNMDPLKTYFDSEVDGIALSKYILDATMYRPRDIVRRLGLVKKKSPNEWKFTAASLHSTFAEYSSQIWQEVREELVPGYTPDEVVALEQSLDGFKRFFFKRNFIERLNQSSNHRTALKGLIARHSPENILLDLFRLGVIGNDYQILEKTSSRFRSRWAFRGDANLDVEKRMVFHRSLWPHLALVSDQASRPPAKVGKQPKA